jgi:hypothetical protein
MPIAGMPVTGMVMSVMVVVIMIMRRHAPDLATKQPVRRHRQPPVLTNW